MSDIALLMAGILSPEISSYNHPQVWQNWQKSIDTKKISKNSQLYQFRSNSQKIIPPEFSEPEKPLVSVKDKPSLVKGATLKRLTQKLYSNFKPMIPEYQQSPKNKQDSLASCTQLMSNEVYERKDQKNQPPLCFGNTEFQVMKVADRDNCSIHNHAKNQILIAATSETIPILKPQLNRQFTSESLPTLSFGNFGLSVKVLQRILLSNGYAVPVDGIFGALTETAVKAFQSNRDLAEDGIVGRNTWRELTI